MMQLETIRFWTRFFIGLSIFSALLCGWDFFRYLAEGNPTKAWMNFFFFWLNFLGFHLNMQNLKRFKEKP